MLYIICTWLKSWCTLLTYLIHALELIQIIFDISVHTNACYVHTVSLWDIFAQTLVIR